MSDIMGQLDDAGFLRHMAHAQSCACQQQEMCQTLVVTQGGACKRAQAQGWLAGPCRPPKQIVCVRKLLTVTSCLLDQACSAPAG